MNNLKNMEFTTWTKLTLMSKCGVVSATEYSGFVWNHQLLRQFRLLVMPGFGLDTRSI